MEDHRSQLRWLQHLEVLWPSDFPQLSTDFLCFHTYIFQYNSPRIVPKLAHGISAKTVLCCGPLYPSTIVQGDGHQQDILLGPLAISGRMAGYGRVVVHSGQCCCSAFRIFQTRNANRGASGQMGSFIFNSLKNDCEMQQDGSCYTPINTHLLGRSCKSQGITVAGPTKLPHHWLNSTKHKEIHCTGTVRDTNSH